jgi:hypothetical protein
LNNIKKYYPVRAKPFLCVAALIESILKTEGFNEYSQDNIAIFFGVTFPSDYNNKPDEYEVSDNSFDWGINVSKKSITSFFIDNHLPFFERFISLSTIAEYEFMNTLNELLKDTGKHIICGYDYYALNNPIRNESVGHVSLIVGICIPDETVSIYDPGPKNSGIKKVNIDDLYYAIRRRNDGLWLISRKNN